MTVKILMQMPKSPLFSFGSLEFHPLLWQHILAEGDNACGQPDKYRGDRRLMAIFRRSVRL
jgi:hypothetical protein